MSELPEPKKVFLDADIVIRAGRPPGGPLLGRLKSLVDDDYNVIKEVMRSHFRKIVKEVLGTTLPETTSTELKTRLTKRYSRSTDAMFKGLRCKTLAIDNVKPSTVFSAYAAGEGFFTGEGKKNQFADAFIFECLKAEASNEEPVIVVSGDGDFDKPVKSGDDILLVKSLPNLFETLGLQADKRQITSFLERHEEELIKAVDDELRSRFFIVEDVNNAEIDDVEVTQVEVLELTNFGSAKKGEPILVVGNLSVAADVEVSMLVTVDKDGKPERIEELRSRDDSFLHVDIGVADPFP